MSASQSTQTATVVVEQTSVDFSIEHISCCMDNEKQVGYTMCGVVREWNGSDESSANCLECVQRKADGTCAKHQLCIDGDYSYIGQ